MILFLVTDKRALSITGNPNDGPNAHVLVMASDRESAKRDAQTWLKANPDKYVVEPLTAEGDQIRFNITMPRW